MNKYDQFSQIEEYPTEVSVSTITYRIVDSLGFRYFWATEGLGDKDGAFEPGNGGRNLHQNLSHIYNMVDFIANFFEGETTVFPEKEHSLDLVDLRYKTLDRILEIKQKIRKMEGQFLEANSIRVEVNQEPMQFSMWHIYNGPLTDVFYHIGQVVSFRRTLGKPIDPAVQPFLGVKLETA